ncbi:Penicillin-binding protein [Halomicronema hongdechloris C2206]|uniref:Penicillin-binding protein n=1 Tax=Halomicronema hongdechloris C2206 TaxID=1641165 RepID=A0A1Z3HGL6_9CYAN|nr:PBP1A family penicillin-binding protein [Halomicronema hongdechloris]ASC69395.1 Penicillin-binding protein [Halomicronema hongdechloris C2206]
MSLWDALIKYPLGHLIERMGPTKLHHAAENHMRRVTQASASTPPASHHARRRRRSPHPPQRRPLYRRPLFWGVLLVAAGVAGGTTRAYRFWVAANATLPDDISRVLTYQRGGTLTIEASDGRILQKLGPATRENIQYEQLPTNLVQAFIASEDRRFYAHNGIDFQAIARAAMANLRQREVVEGASTITQQLARIVFLNQELTFQRKVREALLALKLEQNLSKQQILERYLNLVYLGSGAYGVADAAWVYFGKTVDQLTVAESALIAGMAPAPSLYSPLSQPEAARRQRNRVIRRMQEIGAISDLEAEAALATAVTTTPNQPKYLYSEFPYFTIHVQNQLAQILSPEQLEAGGLVVETTLNIDWQRQAESAVTTALERLGPRQRFRQGALVAIDPRSGEIKAMVGGTDFDESQFNRVTQAQRQPGSTFKTFVYTTAIAAGFSPYKPYVDAKFVVDGYEPKNYSGDYRGTVPLRDALASSINIVAVKLLLDVGFDPVIQMAQRMGIESELLPTYSLSLGASEVTLLELTSAYGTLANQGKHMPTHAIRRVLNSQGEVLYESGVEPQQAVDADTAAIMTWMLQRGGARRATGGNATLVVPWQVRRAHPKKSGSVVCWLYSQLVAGVWLGNDNNQPDLGGE